VTHFANGIAQTQLKRDKKAALLAAVEAGDTQDLRGMTQRDMITMLTQDVADYDDILARLRQLDGAWIGKVTSAAVTTNGG
jgi:hypothetical protein